MRQIRRRNLLRACLLIINALLMHIADAQTDKAKPVVSTGKIIHWESFHSQYVDPRSIDIWLPEGYSSSLRYPVLYMHDGQMLFDSSITWNHQEWQVDETLQHLFDTATVKPFIVVAIWNTGKYRNSEYLPEKPVRAMAERYKNRFIQKEMANRVLADSYLRFIVNELKPAIDSAFQTLPDRAHTFMAGSSKGGLISLYAVCEYPMVFGGAACISTHWIGSMDAGNDEFPASMLRYLRKNLPGAGAHRFYFDHGTIHLDSFYGVYQKRADQIFIGRGYGKNDFLSVEFPGADHTERDWAARFSLPVRFLMK